MIGATALAYSGLPDREPDEVTPNIEPPTYIVTLEELTANLRRVLHRVQAGACVIITQDVEPIASIAPAVENNPLARMHQRAADGEIYWSGEKLKLPTPVRLSHPVNFAALVREMRAECH